MGRTVIRESNATIISLGFIVQSLKLKKPPLMGRFRGVLLFFAKFSQNAASALWMEECDVETVGTITGSLVDKTNALAVAHCESFAHSVFHLEGNVMNASAAVVEELLNGAFRASRLEKFNLHFAHLEESGLHLLVFYNLCFVNLQAENVLEIGQYFVDALHGDAQMLNA
jgi:xanthine/uracil/vitamin C permease (AzgA family)